MQRAWPPARQHHPRGDGGGVAPPRAQRSAVGAILQQRPVQNEIVPFNSEQVVLKVFGAPGAVATINYFDVNAQPQQVKDAPLPWSFTITTTELVVQGDGDTLWCRMTVNGVAKD
ncbi:MmpS family transport accessory protein [Mycobacterium tilburgii]|uniref:MmpS family transport accessory protein n=1 Tax=Mycobacterium tilburgii TaxID=44467 RepID=UPI0016431A6B|nr:MmpS family transport accessory protein [Mycobacterium tilburgii]